MRLSQRVAEVSEVDFPSWEPAMTGRSRLLRPADREGAGRKTRRDCRVGIRACGLRRGDPSARASEQEIRIPSQVGRRPAVGARALFDRKIREKAGHRDEPPGMRKIARRA